MIHVYWTKKYVFPNLIMQRNLLVYHSTLHSHKWSLKFFITWQTIHQPSVYLSHYVYQRLIKHIVAKFTILYWSYSPNWRYYLLFYLIQAYSAQEHFSRKHKFIIMPWQYHIIDASINGMRKQQYISRENQIRLPLKASFHHQKIIEKQLELWTSNSILRFLSIMCNLKWLICNNLKTYCKCINV